MFICYDGENSEEKQGGLQNRAVDDAYSLRWVELITMDDLLAPHQVDTNHAFSRNHHVWACALKTYHTTKNLSLGMGVKVVFVCLNFQ